MKPDSPLAYYGSAWLYSGFDAESGTPGGAALKFVLAGGGDAGEFATELRALLADCRSDARLAAALRDLGADYAPRAAGRLRRELTEAREVVHTWEHHARELRDAVQSALDEAPVELTSAARCLLQALLEERSDYSLAAVVQELTGQPWNAEPRVVRQRLAALLA